MINVSTEMRFVWNSLTDGVMSCFSLQVLLYDPNTNAWTEIARLKTRRSFHAITEVNLGALGCLGNLNPVKKKEHKIREGVKYYFADFVRKGVVRFPNHYFW